ncbi:MAG: AI-2E family transporter [Clostridia bacterium]|nr:AI-2E family transporter [Clostridia bacterium]
MKKLSLKAYITVLAVGLVIFNYVISNYDFFQVLKKGISPILFGFVIAYLIDPLVKLITKYTKNKIRRGFAILFAVFLIISMLILFSSVLIPSIVNSITNIIDNLTNYFQNDFSLTFIESFLNRFNSNLFSGLITYLNSSLEEIVVKVGEMSTILLDWTLSFVSSATSGLYNFLMAFVISIYMLADKKDLLRRVKRLNYAVNDKELADKLYHVTIKAHEIFSRFFVGKIIDSAIIGLMCFVIMWIAKIPNAPAIGFVVGITNIIPYFGPFIGAIPALLVTLASGTWIQVLVVAVIIIALQQFDGLYLGPLILGNKVGVGAFWIIISVTVGGALFGVVGMLVGVPVVVLVKTLIEEFIARSLEEKNIDIP